MGRRAGRRADPAARRCGYPEAEALALRRASLVHDIGRVAISAGIWGKRAPLSAGDWEQVRLHAYHSERVLSRSAFLAALAPVSSSHHERLDGTGYHRGSGAAALNPPARLLAAADAYHAMTEPRPHREALAPQRAAEELSEEARAGRLDADSVTAVLETAGHHAPRRIRPAGLTDREVQVIALLARGSQTKQVARTLGISVKTADRHVQNAYAKIGVSTRAAAALFAMEHRLTAWGEFPIVSHGGRSERPWRRARINRVGAEEAVMKTTHTAPSESIAATEVVAAQRSLSWSAWAGIVGPILFTAGFLAQEAFRRDEYSPVAEVVSALEAGPNGWIQQVNFVVFGALTLVFAVGLHRGLRPTRAGVAGPALLFGSGIGLVLAAALPLREDAAGVTYDPGGHFIAGITFFLTSALGLIVVSRRVAHDPLWRGLAPYTLTVGVLALIGFFAMPVLVIPDDAPLHDWAGLIQRALILLLIFPGRIVLSHRLLRIARGHR